eukprot:COSAG01_NODE_9802_length_2340_cov_2.643463_1_plen_164_part_00
MMVREHGSDPSPASTIACSRQAAVAEWRQPAGAAVAQARRITETLSSRPSAVTLWRGRTLDADAKGVDSNSQAQAAQEGPHGTASSAAIQACEGAGTAVAGTAVAAVPIERSAYWSRPIRCILTHFHVFRNDLHTNLKRYDTISPMSSRHCNCIKLTGAFTRV